jgi:D-3-phosphoglycerate dehydrogenase
MPVMAWSRSLTAAAAHALGIERKDDPLDVAREADIVSVHVALKPETRGFVGAPFLAAMRPGSIFINTSRAEVVDQAALEAAIRDNGLRAGLDVFAGEPAGGTGSLDESAGAIFRLPGVAGTHHIGASTDQAQEAIAAETVRIVREYLQSGRAPNVINLTRKSPATHLLVVRHFDRVGVLAAVFDSIKEAGINVQETENIVFDGAQAAVARIHLNQAPGPDVLDRIRRSTPDIIEIALLAL